MRPAFILLISVMLAHPAMAQTDSVYAYYNQNWDRLPDSTDAAFFRVVKDAAYSRFLVRDYYITGALQFSALCAKVEPTIEKEGEAVYYYKSGIVKRRGYYADNKPIGLHRYFYEDGSPHKEISYRVGEKDVYHQFWSREGKAQLVKGSGSFVEHADTGPPYHYEVKDSVAVAIWSTDESGKLVYTMVEQLPEYRGGYAAMGADLHEHLVYPRNARRLGIEGTVYVSFVVTDAGDVSDVRTLRGIHAECDASAEIAVSSLNNWIPGRHHGRPVSVKYVLPVKFALK